MVGVGVERGFGSGGAEPGVEEGGVERLGLGGGVEIGRFCCGGGGGVCCGWRGGVAVVWGSDVGLERGDLGEEVVLGEVADGWMRFLFLLLLLLSLLARCKKIIFNKTSKRHNFLRPIGFRIATPDFDRNNTVATESFV